MNFNELIKELDQLKLPKDQYVVVGSGALAARGIREANDFDILVTDELWNKLKDTYPLTKTTPVENIDIGNIQFVGKGSMFRHSDVSEVENTIKTADVFQGHRFINLDLLKRFKQREGRDKDLKDIELINKYLNS